MGEMRRNAVDRQRGGVIGGIFAVLFLLILIAAGAAAAVGYLAWKRIEGPGPSETATVVWLKPGMSVSAIGETLEEEGVVEEEILFRGAVRMKRADAKLRAGEYEFPAGASVLDVIDQLVSGDVILHTLTIPEGRTSAQIALLVAEAEMLAGDMPETPAEGVLLPETYAFARGETRAAILQRMEKAQDDLLDALWEDRATGLPFTTREEAIILASIIEKETGVDAERARVAAVFVNRLERGMRLESDPTVIYGLTQGEPLGRGIRQSELRGETPYNTYVVKGLPPTPIANPGRAAIEATLNPADTDDIFFVADGTGGHAFASSLSEHNRNVAAWRRIERERKAAVAEKG